jgi:hypothetical protein
VIHYVDPREVKFSGENFPYNRDVKSQMNLLERQGQIEPLLAKRVDDVWEIDNSDYPYATAQVLAAQRLHWPTIIVTEGDPDDD